MKIGAERNKLILLAVVSRHRGLHGLFAAIQWLTWSAGASSESVSSPSESDESL